MTSLKVGRSQLTDCLRKYSADSDDPHTRWVSFRVCRFRAASVKSTPQSSETLIHLHDSVVHYWGDYIILWERSDCGTMGGVLRDESGLIVQSAIDLQASRQAGQDGIGTADSQFGRIDPLSNTRLISPNCCGTRMSHRFELNLPCKCKVWCLRRSSRPF